MADKINRTQIAYTFGIISIIMAFVSPISGIAFGIVGLFQCKNEKEASSRKARKMNIIGICIGILVFVTMILLTYYFQDVGSSTFQNFPA